MAAAATHSHTHGARPAGADPEAGAGATPAGAGPEAGHSRPGGSAFGNACSQGLGVEAQIGCAALAAARSARIEAAFMKPTVLMAAVFSCHWRTGAVGTFWSQSHWR